MDWFYFALLVVGAICFALSALKIENTRVHLLSLGLLAWILVPLIQAGRAL